MPIYEYLCGACDYKMEKLQKFSDEPLKECPKCNQLSLKKLISPVSFRLKGTGWYETDFKSGPKKNVRDDSSASPSKSGSDNQSSATTKDTGTAAKSGDKKLSSDTN